MRMIVKKTLRQAGYEGLDALEAANGVEALKIIQESSPDLLMLDWNMPEMTGLELVEKLKELNIRGKFGFVTSEGTEDMGTKAKDAGSLFFISKPFTLENFQEKLAGVLS